MKSLYTKISFSKTQVLFCNFRVLSARGFWTGFSILNTRKTEKRELYYYNLLPLMRDTSAENIGNHIFYYIWYTRNTSDSITIFGPYRSVLRDIWGTRKNTWKMEILPVKRNKSLVLKEIRIMLLPIFCWRLFGCIRKCLGIFFHVLNLNQHKTYRFPAFQIHIAQTGPIEVIPLQLCSPNLYAESLS